VIKQKSKSKKFELSKEYSTEDLAGMLKKVEDYPYMHLELNDLDNEEWEDYNLENILSMYNKNHYIGKRYHNIEKLQVSSKGRVKIILKGNNEPRILLQTDDLEGGYLRLPEFPGFGNVYRLVAEVWLEHSKERNIVHHINNDGYDNSVNNLIWVTAEEHNEIHTNT